MVEELFEFSGAALARFSKQEVDRVCEIMGGEMERAEDFNPSYIVAMSKDGTVYRYEISAARVECDEMRPYSPAEREADCAAQSALLRLSYLARSGKDRYISDEVDDLVAKLRNRI